MLKKELTYVDFNGEERKESFYFHLTEAEIMSMELGTSGGLAEHIQAIVDAKDAPQIEKLFQELILKAYGEKSPDGKYFMKKDENGYLLANKFAQTQAYSDLYMELATNAEAAAAFVNGVVPNGKALANNGSKFIPGKD